MDDKLTLIIEGASKLFMNYGIRSISMDDICKELSISKKTLYQYFSNKEELVKEVLNSINEQVIGAFENLQQQNLNAIDELLEASVEVSKHLKNLNPAFSYDLEKYYPEINRSHLELKKGKIIKLIHRNIAKGKSEGFYREDLNVELVASLYIQRLMELTNPEYLDYEKFSFVKIFQVMFENHIRGISNPKGIEYYEQKKKNFKIKL